MDGYKVSCENFMRIKMVYQWKRWRLQKVKGTKR
jgi:hypothetical protein